MIILYICKILHASLSLSIYIYIGQMYMYIFIYILQVLWVWTIGFVFWLNLSIFLVPKVEDSGPGPQPSMTPWSILCKAIHLPKSSESNGKNVCP